ncbi:hypothetical protein M3Y99_01380800 [Aphelenchoides fujianensis]|nr:hypothetical protein M3Y99_01380800 [Aphelenchoides fujianensis]
MWFVLLFPLFSFASASLDPLDVPFDAPYEFSRVAFNLSLGTPGQLQRILLLDDFEYANLTVGDVAAGGSYDPSASTNFQQLGYSFDHAGEADGVFAKEAFRIDTPEASRSQMLPFVVRNDSFASLWAPFGAAGLSCSGDEQTTFLENLAAQAGKRVITFSLDNSDYKPREETTGLMTIGGLAPARCQSNAEFFAATRALIVDWVVQADEATFGTTTIDAPGPLRVSVGNWWFGLPFSLMPAAMRAAGVNSDFSIDCAVNVVFEFKVGSFEFVVGPADYLERHSDDLCTWTVLAMAEIWLPASVLNGTCLHLDYEQSAVGFSSRIPN